MCKKMLNWCQQFILLRRTLNAKRFFAFLLLTYLLSFSLSFIKITRFFSLAGQVEILKVVGFVLAAYFLFAIVLQFLNDAKVDRLRNRIDRKIQSIWSILFKKEIFSFKVYRENFWLAVTAYLIISYLLYQNVPNWINEQVNILVYIGLAIKIYIIYYIINLFTLTNGEKWHLLPIAWSPVFASIGAIIIRNFSEIQEKIGLFSPALLKNLPSHNIFGLFLVLLIIFFYNKFTQSITSKWKLPATSVLSVVVLSTLLATLYFVQPNSPNMVIDYRQAVFYMNELMVGAVVIFAIILFVKKVTILQKMKTGKNDTTKIISGKVVGTAKYKLETISLLNVSLPHTDRFLTIKNEQDAEFYLTKHKKMLLHDSIEVLDIGTRIELIAIPVQNTVFSNNGSKTFTYHIPLYLKKTSDSILDKIGVDRFLGQ